MRRLLDSPWFYAAVAIALIVVGVLSQLEIRIPSRPKGSPESLASLSQRDDLNVVFVLIDTLRADHLSSYGYGRSTSPIMDEIARYGIRFEHVQAQSSWTKPSMASLWLGSYPEHTGVHRSEDGLPEKATVPAEILKQAGFYTAGIFRNGWVATNFGFGQGFDLYFKPQGSRRAERVQRRTLSAAKLPGHDLDLTEAAAEFLNAHAHERFLLYLHYMDVHQYVFDEGSALFGTKYLDSYDNAIHWTDRNMGLLFKELDDRDLLDKTLVVIASDHGEAFYEHGVEGHAKNLYREVVETPLILSLPFRLNPGIVVEPVVRNIDVWPTVLDLLGLPPIPGSQGRSLVPLILAAGRGEALERAAEEELAIAQIDRWWAKAGETLPVASVVKGPWRLIYRRQQADNMELFDRRKDPLESRNLIGAHAEVAEELREEAESILNGSPPPGGEAEKVELDEMRKSQLRALGYIVH
jgi:arylsulfatase A-like enzyme